MKLAFVHLDHPCKAMPGREPSATWSEENLPGMRYDATTNSVDFGNGRGVPWVRVLSWHRGESRSLDVVRLDEDNWDARPAKPFACTWCERSFSSPQALGGHKSKCDRRPE